MVSSISKGHKTSYNVLFAFTYVNAVKKDPKATHQISRGHLFVVASQERDWLELPEDELSLVLSPLILSKFMEKTLSERIYPALFIQLKLDYK